MILPDHEICRRLRTKDQVRVRAQDLCIDPLPVIQPASVDLRLGNRFQVQDSHSIVVIYPGEHSGMSQEVEVEDGRDFLLHPGEFALGSTLEWIEIPYDLVARMEGKSSLGRLGLQVHATAGFFDPGFCGTGTLELSNVNKLPIALRPGMKICQMSFSQLLSPAQKPYGHAELNSKYMGQEGPTPSRYGSRAAVPRLG